MRQLFRISVLFVLGQLLCKAVTQQCGSEISILGWMLQGHIYNTYHDFIILNLFYHVHCNAGGDDIRLVGDAGDASSSFPLMNSTGQHMLKGIGRARSLCLINR